METKTFEVPNVGCNGCVSTIKNEVSELDGVTSVDGNPDTKMITVTFGSPTTWETIVSKLKQIDYAPAEA